MLKKSASGVLASRRDSTYRSVRLASSLAAALLDSLFEHPAGYIPVIPDVQTSNIPACPQSFSADCQAIRLDLISINTSLQAHYQPLIMRQRCSIYSLTVWRSLRAHERTNISHH